MFAYFDENRRMVCVSTLETLNYPFSARITTEWDGRFGILSEDGTIIWDEEA